MSVLPYDDQNLTQQPPQPSSNEPAYNNPTPVPPQQPVNNPPPAPQDNVMPSVQNTVTPQPPAGTPMPSFPSGVETAPVIPEITPTPEQSSEQLVSLEDLKAHPCRKGDHRSSPYP